MQHIVLLGDSIFDNGAYTAGGPDVAAHLRDLLGPAWAVTLCAVDGATTESAPAQFGRIPEAATHLFLSVGGNDALMNFDLLQQPVRSVYEALGLLHQRVAAFAAAYERVLERLLGVRRPITVCTMYHGDLGPDLAAQVSVAAGVYKDVILRAALRHGLRAIDLRAVCDRPEHFVNAIEPSVSGGRKIAQAIVQALAAADGGANG